MMNCWEIYLLISVSESNPHKSNTYKTIENTCKPQLNKVFYSCSNIRLFCYVLRFYDYICTLFVPHQDLTVYLYLKIFFLVHKVHTLIH